MIPILLRRDRVFLLVKEAELTVLLAEERVLLALGCTTLIKLQREINLAALLVWKQVVHLQDLGQLATWGLAHTEEKETASHKLILRMWSKVLDLVVLLTINSVGKVQLPGQVNIVQEMRWAPLDQRCQLAREAAWLTIRRMHLALEPILLQNPCKVRMVAPWKAGTPLEVPWTTTTKILVLVSTTQTFLETVVVEMELWDHLCALTLAEARTKLLVQDTSILTQVLCPLELALTTIRVTMWGKCVILN